MKANPYIPLLVKIKRIKEEVPRERSVKTFMVEKPPGFSYSPSQCAMIGILGKGESMISISSSPTDQSLGFSVLRMGKVTSVLHECEEGDLIICGAYGNGFPVEFVPANLLRVAPSPENAIAVTFGPPVMIKFVEQNLLKLGFSPEQIYTTLEARMKCGIGKCGRCNIGNVYICKDGPVFSYKQIKEFLEEI